MSSGHGGARSGAGRPKGSANRLAIEAREAAAAAGITPLDYMLGLLRDETKDQALRFEAAKAAAPYLHPKLSAVEHSGEMTLHHEDALDELDDDEPREADSEEAEG